VTRSGIVPERTTGLLQLCSRGHLCITVELAAVRLCWTPPLGSSTTHAGCQNTATRSDLLLITATRPGTCV